MVFFYKQIMILQGILLPLKTFGYFKHLKPSTESLKGSLRMITERREDDEVCNIEKECSNDQFCAGIAFGFCENCTDICGWYGGDPIFPAAQSNCEKTCTNGPYNDNLESNDGDSLCDVDTACSGDDVFCTDNTLGVCQNCTDFCGIYQEDYYGYYNYIGNETVSICESTCINGPYDEENELFCDDDTPCVDANQFCTSNTLGICANCADMCGWYDFVETVLSSYYPSFFLENATSNCESSCVNGPYPACEDEDVCDAELKCGKDQFCTSNSFGFCNNCTDFCGFFGLLTDSYYGDTFVSVVEDSEANCESTCTDGPYEASSYYPFLVGLCDNNTPCPKDQYCSDNKLGSCLECTHFCDKYADILPDAESNCKKSCVNGPYEPTVTPTRSPTARPTESKSPSFRPSTSPSVSQKPSVTPSSTPSSTLSSTPSSTPSASPSSTPTKPSPVTSVFVPDIFLTIDLVNDILELVNRILESILQIFGGR